MSKLVYWEDREEIEKGDKETALRCILNHAIDIRNDILDGGSQHRDQDCKEIAEFAEDHGLAVTDSIVGDLISGIHEMNEDAWLASQNHWNDQYLADEPEEEDDLEHGKG